MDMVECMLNELATYPKDAIRAGILGLQHQIMNSNDAVDIANCPVKHVFAPGVYAREITMPAGLVVIGKLHRHSHVNVISKGRVRVLTELGVQELNAPCTFTSEVGTKRVVYVIEETVWTTIHVTEETALINIERYVIAEDYSDLEITTEYSVQESTL